MSGDLVVRWLELLGGLSILLQCLEYWRIADSTDPQGVWAWQVQRADIPASPPWVRRVLNVLYRPGFYRAQLLLRAAAALALMAWGNQLWLALVLFTGQLLLLVRWRGAFNGGSDFMTIVVLSGLLIAMLVGASGDSELGWRAGMIYIAIHAASSYFISGGIKLLNPEWRSGEALALFLDGGIYGPLSRLSLYWLRPVAMLCSWAFILWDCLVPLAFFDAELAVIYCAVAGLFHFLVFWYFGLNRFVFAWLASFPAIIYVASQLN